MIKRASLYLVPVCIPFLAFPGMTQAQCSDAGVCVIGQEHREGHSFGLSYVYGTSGKDSTLSFHTVRLEGTYKIFETADIYLSIPFSLQEGSAGTVSSVGDLLLLWNQTVFDHTGTMRIQGGVKLATGEVNAKNLPQAYQSGLGTNDVLLGASYEISNLSVAAAYQITTGRSANRIDRLRRGDDLMLRAGYTHRPETMTIAGEVLAIKRIQESSILAGTQQETFANVPNSNQLQVNLIGRFIYNLDDHYLLRTEGALALLQRDTNVDGLKRAFTLSLGITYLL